MSKRSIGLSKELHDYVLQFGLREPAILKELRDETAAHPESQMQIAPEQGQFMALLLKLLGARHILEIGVFTGYSSTVMALAMPGDGRLVACDVSEEYTNVARRYWESAGVADRIDLRIAPATETLEELLSEGASFDFAFIDADKTQYDVYYEKTLELLRPGGAVAIDNVFRGGRVADPTVDDDGTVAIRRLNEKIYNDQRVDFSLVPIADGVTVARKR